MMDTCSTRIAHPPRHVSARDVPRSLRSAGPRCVFSTTKTTFCSVLQKKDLERDELTKGYPTESHVSRSSLARAEHHAVCHPDQPPPSHGFDHWRIQQLRQWQPAGLGRRACGLVPWRLHPVPIVREQGGHVLSEPIGQKQ